MLNALVWRQRLWKKMFLLLVFQLVVAIQVNSNWSSDMSERPANLPTLSSLDVTCYKNHMTVTASFSDRFQGTIFSKGNSGQEGCVYVQPHSGERNFQFNVQYDRCGTNPDINGKLYENTIVIQYGTDLIEVWDEAKRLRCEWFNDYQKTQAANPPVLIDDLEEIQQEFVGDHIEVWMEIQEGKGPWASQVSGIVPLGSTLTLVVAINDSSHEFDMLVRSCVASDGVRQPLLLSDDTGCIMRPKMFGAFQKIRVNDGRASMVTYAHFQAFKFPDALSVHLQCRVMICRYGCPDHCQKPVTGNDVKVQKRTDLTSEAVQAAAQTANHQSAHASAHTSAQSSANDSVPPAAQLVSGPSPSFGPRNLRIRRSTAENAGPGQEYAVAEIFNAISRTDFAFTPNNFDTVDRVSGHEPFDSVLCVPTLRFSMLFIVVASLTAIAVGTATIVAYRHFGQTGKKMCQ